MKRTRALGGGDGSIFDTDHFEANCQPQIAAKLSDDES